MVSATEQHSSQGIEDKSFTRKKKEHTGCVKCTAKNANVRKMYSKRKDVPIICPLFIIQDAGKINTLSQIGSNWFSISDVIGMTRFALCID